MLTDRILRERIIRANSEYCACPQGVAYIFPVLVIFKILDLLLGTSARSLLQVNAEVLSLLCRHHDPCTTTLRNTCWGGWIAKWVASSGRVRKSRVRFPAAQKCWAQMEFVNIYPCATKLRNTCDLFVRTPVLSRDEDDDDDDEIAYFTVR